MHNLSDLLMNRKVSRAPTANQKVNRVRWSKKVKGRVISFTSVTVTCPVGVAHGSYMSPNRLLMELRARCSFSERN